MSLIKSVIYHILDSPSVDIQYIGPEGNISALGYASADILPSGPIYCISTSGGPIYIIYIYVISDLGRHELVGRHDV
jgi:hypothetical protein